MIDFSLITSSDGKHQQEKSLNETKATERLVKQFNTVKIKSHGSNYILNELIAVYKLLTDDTNSFDVSYKGYKNKAFQNVLYSDKINSLFTTNTIIVNSIKALMDHLKYISKGSFEKLINILVKIKYNDLNNWKSILEQYLYFLFSRMNYQDLFLLYLAEFLVL